jgi:hypothetical protein
VHRLTLAFLLLLAILAAPAQPAAAKKKPRPVGAVPAGKTLVVVGQSGVDKADAFEAGTQTAPAGAMWYFGLYEGEEAITAHLDAIEKAVAERPGLIVNLGISFGAVSTPSPPYTAAIAAGAYDAELKLIADRLKKLDTIVYTRLGYEFDLLGGQYGPAELYKAAYRHIVDVLRGHDLRNAVYVWHSSGAFWRATDPSLFAVSSGTLAKTLRDDVPVDIDPQPIAAFYPGRQYVDAFAISYWQDSCCFGESSDQAKAEYEERTREILDQAKAMGLPLMIGEATPVYVGADSNAKSVAWIDRTFDLIEDYDIRMLSLISIDWQEGGFFAAPFWNGYWPDARIHHFPKTRDAYLRRAADERYVLRTPDLPRWLGLRKAKPAKPVKRAR